ncbi:putative suppressor of forked, tetratricopeptide-like helical domain-containing protein [Lupinus albus]|uniref:Putative suppressor of forked, tetratricopeptide-like helical domain-containing protein n=1 Tax=Lupinus albus TaxID=3870 RepID=A0A6A4QH29_LUPAL|nr:putative suppressor of forked, tetratricopeptide-like helical domain-containing protein [Lupinus albus]
MDKINGAGKTMSDKYNVETAEILANEAQHLPIAEATPIYEQLLQLYPTSAKFWKQYVEANLAVNNDDATKQIFSRCLLNCLQIPLWRCYIRFIRKANDKKGIEGQEETKKAFEFMLNYVGADIASGPVWMEYISFLKLLPALNAQEESQRMTAVRKVYQRAIITPTHHIEQIWKDYENFENSVSRQLAKGLISEYQPKYTSARAVYRERKKYFDEIDWNMLAVPPTGEETQWMAWKRLLSFEKGNPQRIDAASSNKRIIFTYEQSLMYMYHYPDIWYDYATWHAKGGSIDAAIKVFQRSLKALPDSEILRYAYAELEESRGAIQAAKKIYENLLGDGVNATTLAHIQFIRFLRRTEGVEAARKYFLDARKSPSCTYHVYVAYATLAFCLDKDPKMAHNVFEAGLKRFMLEPVYILEYADFLTRLNDDQNIRALFERALSSLPPEKSVEVWKKFIHFEQTYGDLASMLKVELRRKEALSGSDEDGISALGSSLQDVVSRYSFMDLWPCSSNDLDHLTRQEWLGKNIHKKVEKSAMPNGTTLLDKESTGYISTMATKVVYPDTSKMVIYDPKQNPVAGAGTNAFDEILKATPPALVAFLANLPAVEGPTPNVDIVLSICLQSDLLTSQSGKTGIPTQLQSAKTVVSTPLPATSELSGSNKSHPVASGLSFKPTNNRQYGKRKDSERQEDDDTTSIQSQPPPRDAFRIRQYQKARMSSTSQTGSVSYGSQFSGDLSGSTS